MPRTARVSLCMIVRDEERCLARCLAAARPFVDEICIVDTGSRDDTVAIARRHGARVREIAWPDDFSAARNVALDMAEGDWILVLDADETLRPDGLAAFDRLVDDPRAEAGHLVVVNHYEDGRTLTCFVLRAFRNRPEHRFVGAIHEQVVHAVRAGCARHGTRILETGVALDHDGYHADQRNARDKDGRDRPLFEKALRERPEDAYLWYKFGDFLRRFADRDAVIDALERCLAAAAAPGSPWSDAVFVPEAHALLALELLEGGRLEAASERLAAADALGLASPLLHWVAGHAALRREDWRAAERRFRACHAYDGRPAHLPAPPGVTGGRAVFGIARARLGSGDVDGARALFVEGAERWPDCADLVKAAARVDAEAGRHGAALQRLGTLLSRDPRDAEAWRAGAEILLEAGLDARARSFLARALEHARGPERTACETLELELALFAGAVPDAARLAAPGGGGRRAAVRAVSAALRAGGALRPDPHVAALARRLARSADPGLQALLAPTPAPFVRA